MGHFHSLLNVRARGFLTLVWPYNRSFSGTALQSSLSRNTSGERLRILLQGPYSDRPEIFSRYGIDPESYAAETPESHVEMQLSCSA